MGIYHRFKYPAHTKAGKKERRNQEALSKRYLGVEVLPGDEVKTLTAPPGIKMCRQTDVCPGNSTTDQLISGGRCTAKNYSEMMIRNSIDIVKNSKGVVTKKPITSEVTDEYLKRGIKVAKLVGVTFAHCIPCHSDLGTYPAWCEHVRNRHSFLFDKYQIQWNIRQDEHYAMPYFYCRRCSDAICLQENPSYQDVLSHTCNSVFQTLTSWDHHLNEVRCLTR